jgi:hypothetical protein
MPMWRLVVLDPRHVLLVRQRNRLRAGHTELGGERRIEQLVVGRPHERIVHHRHPLEHRVLQVGAIIRHLVRDAVDDHRVRHRLVHRCAAELHVLHFNAFVATRDLLDEGGWEAPFAAYYQSDLQHVSSGRVACAAGARCEV